MASIEKKPLPDATGRRPPAGRTGPHVLRRSWARCTARTSWPALERAPWPGPSAATARCSSLLADPFRGRKPNGSYSNHERRLLREHLPRLPGVARRRDVHGPGQDRSARSRPHFRAAAYNDLTCAFWSVPPQREPAAGDRAPGRRRSWWSARPATRPRRTHGRRPSPSSSSRASSSPARARGTRATSPASACDKAVDAYLLDAHGPEGRADLQDRLTATAAARGAGAPGGPAPGRRRSAGTRSRRRRSRR